MRDDERVSFTITPKKNENGVGAIGISPMITNVFATVVPGSYFARMGLQSGDKLVAIDGFRGELTLDGFPKEKIPPVWDFHEPDPKTLQLDVERNGQTVKVSLVAEPQEEADLASAGFPTNHSGYLITMESKPFRRRALGDAIKMGLKEPVDVTIMTFDILKKLLTGGESPGGLSGPIGIIHASYAFAKMHFGNFVWLLCLITVNLGIFNLLPIPILDGGHNLLLLIEVVRKWFGKPPPSEKFIAGFQYVGLAFILTLFVFVTFNDITRFFGPRG
jgi:regulator of sigma E protease